MFLTIKPTQTNIYKLIYCILISFNCRLVCLISYLKFAFPKYCFVYGSLHSESLTSDFDSVYIYILNLFLNLNYLFY